MKFIFLAVLFLACCDGTYKPEPLPPAERPVIPLGELCDPKEPTDYITGCYVCPSGSGFYDCCRLRPEHFACTCMEIRGATRWFTGFCSIPLDSDASTN